MDRLDVRNTQSPPTEFQAPELTRERLADMLSLEIEVTGDFGSVLEAMRTATGADLQPRGDGLHLTIIGPNEYEVVSTLDDNAVSKLQAINAQIQRGGGITVKGIGYIDGASSPYRLRDADTKKKTAFIALDIPALQAFRSDVGLPPKDFHITLGFEGNDIYTHIVGEEPVKPGSPKMKNITAAIPKQADPRFKDIPIPEMHFGGLNGQMKQRK